MNTSIVHENGKGGTYCSDHDFVRNEKKIILNINALEIHTSNERMKIELF